MAGKAGRADASSFTKCTLIAGLAFKIGVQFARALLRCLRSSGARNAIFEFRIFRRLALTDEVLTADGAFAAFFTRVFRKIITLLASNTNMVSGAFETVGNFTVKTTANPVGGWGASNTLNFVKIAWLFTFFTARELYGSGSIAISDHVVSFFA